MDGYPGEEPDDTSRAPEGDPQQAASAPTAGGGDPGTLPGWNPDGSDDALAAEEEAWARLEAGTETLPGFQRRSPFDDEWDPRAPRPRFDPSPPPGLPPEPEPVTGEVDVIDDGEPSAPAVVAVVVTHDPGEWFEDALGALADQDYPALSVLVIDSGSQEDPTPRVAAVMPTAFVRRLPENVGFAAAANEVLTVVEGASHFVFAHDDAAPEPEAIRLMVEEAFRSNAGVVAPKLVDWDDSQRLLQIGLGADKSGAPADLVEPGELDQEQHDSVRDVFCAPGAFTLVRADLFETLGGFDPVMTAFGEDLDLSWRAQVVGARVIVAPAARVRHREAMSLGLREVPGPVARRARSVRDRVRPARLRHRLRTVLTCYSTWHLLRVLPQILLLAIGEFFYGLVKGRRAVTFAVFNAWRWNLGNVGDIRRRRARLKAIRALPDSEVRRLQVRGSARMTAFVRGQLTGDDDFGGLAESLLETRAELERPSGRIQLAVWGALAFVLFVGSRHLLAGGLPAVGELAPFPENPGPLLASYLSGWRTTGLGAEAAAPPAFALLGIAGTVLLGAMGLLQKLLVLGPIVLGLIGMHHLAKPFGLRPRLVAAAVYAALPLPYDALARGRWSGLIAYGLTPWIVAGLVRAMGVAPFDARPRPDGGKEGLEPQRWPRPDKGGRRTVLHGAVALGVITTVGAAFAPGLVFVPVIVAVGLLVGSGIVGGVAASSRALAVAAGAVAVVALLLLPLTINLAVPGSTWSAVAGVDLAPARGLGLGHLLRFETGPVGAAPIGWAFVIAAVLPLAIGKGWRLAWAARLWFVALVAWGLLLAGGRLAIGLPAPELLLAPAAVAIAATIALGLAAFEIDLPGYRFGWRQVASITAAAAVALSALPWLHTALGGRWNLPRRDLRSLVSWMPEQVAQGDFRVLWVADPEALPLGGWRLDEGLAYATSRNGPPTVTDLWPSVAPGASELLAQAVTVARQGQTTSLGHLLAPMGVRYIVLPGRAAPGRGRTGNLPVPRDVREAFAAQVDLRQLESDPAIEIYENAAWGPMRAKVEGDVLEALRRPGLASSVLTELRGAAPVLPESNGRTTFEGPLAAGYVYHAEAASTNWELTVAGERVAHDRASWANAFAVDRAGEATLRYRTPWTTYIVLLVQLGAWVATLRWLWRGRRKRRATT